MYIYGEKETEYEELALKITEAEKPYILPSANWRLQESQ